MAKQSKKKPKRRPRTAYRSLWGYYQLGKKVLKADKEGRKQGNKRVKLGVYKKVRREVFGIPEEDDSQRFRDEIEKARRFASEYSPSQVKWLRKLRNERGQPLNKSHVQRLLTVPKPYRKKFAERTAKENWSAQKLADEIIKKLSKRSLGGKLPTRPKTIEDALIQVDRMYDRWRRWDRMIRRPEADESAGIDVGDLHEDVASPLKRITRGFDELLSAMKKGTKGRTRKSSGVRKKVAKKQANKPGKRKKRPAATGRSKKTGSATDKKRK